MQMKSSTRTNRVFLPEWLEDTPTFEDIWQRFEILLNRTIPAPGRQAPALIHAKRYTVDAGGDRKSVV